MCQKLDVPRSSFYAWRAGVDVVTANAARRKDLGDKIKLIFTDRRKVYGCRRITAELNATGTPCSVGLVASIMREIGLVAIQPRAWKRTTTKGDCDHDIPDLIGRDFAPDTGLPGQRLVGDITYLRTGQGWLYLATVIDLATRMVIGWQLADNMRTPLIIDALKMARTHGRVAPKAIFHSDRGSQYTSDDFHGYCEKNGFIQSMGRTGVCWDNSVAESFFSSLKNEMYHHQVFTTRTRARFAVADYIEIFYNRKRIHSSLGYQTPAQTWAQKTQIQVKQAA